MSRSHEFQFALGDHLIQRIEEPIGLEDDLNEEFDVKDFGFPLDEDLEQDEWQIHPMASTWGAEEKWGEKSTVERVALDSLMAGQPTVSRLGVQHYAENLNEEGEIRDWDSKYDTSDEHHDREIDLHPRVVRQDGRHRLIDGHHRTMAARYLGHDEIPVRLMDVDRETSGGLQGVLFEEDRMRNDWVPYNAPPEDKKFLRKRWDWWR